MKIKLLEDFVIKHAKEIIYTVQEYPSCVVDGVGLISTITILQEPNAQRLALLLRLLQKKVCMQIRCFMRPARLQIRFRHVKYLISQIPFLIMVSIIWTK